MPTHMVWARGPRYLYIQKKRENQEQSHTALLRCSTLHACPSFRLSLVLSLPCLLLFLLVISILLVAPTPCPLRRRHRFHPTLHRFRCSSSPSPFPLSPSSLLSSRFHLRPLPRFPLPRHCFVSSPGFACHCHRVSSRLVLDVIRWMSKTNHNELWLVFHNVVVAVTICRCRLLWGSSLSFGVGSVFIIK